MRHPNVLFGLAHDAAGRDPRVTTEGAQPGTLLYMSPEQVRGLPVDARSDLYAAAALFQEALTGRHYLPVAGRTDFQVRQLIAEGRALPARGAPPAVADFLARGLAKEPSARFGSAEAMRKAASAALAEAPAARSA